MVVPKKITPANGLIFSLVSATSVRSITGARLRSRLVIIRFSLADGYGPILARVVVSTMTPYSLLFLCL